MVAMMELTLSPQFSLIISWIGKYMRAEQGDLKYCLGDG